MRKNLFKFITILTLMSLVLSGCADNKTKETSQG